MAVSDAVTGANLFEDRNLIVYVNKKSYIGRYIIGTGDFLSVSGQISQ